MKSDSKQISSQFEIIAEEAFMGFLVFSKKTRQCVYANTLAKELLELPRRKTIEDISLESLAEKKPRANLRTIDEDLLTHEGFYQDVYIRKTNGHPFIANLGVKQFSQHDEDFYLLMIQDITIQKKLQRDLVTKQEEIKSAYEELLVQNEQLKELDKAKNRFIALTTHELRTPLSAMIASAEVLKNKIYDNEEQLNEFVDIIYEQGHHLSELINDILDFTKIQAGKMDFYVEHLDLTEFLTDVVHNLEQMFEHYSVKLNYQPMESEQRCYFDTIRLKQILNNVIDNACKYNKKGGEVRIWIEWNDHSGKVFVADTGTGIPEDKKSDVFNEFETLGKVATHHEGTGLGMPISKRLIEAMGGSISFESDEGVGSVFCIEIPKEKVLNEECYRVRPADAYDLVS